MEEATQLPHTSSPDYINTADSVNHSCDYSLEWKSLTVTTMAHVYVAHETGKPTLKSCDDDHD